MSEDLDNKGGGVLFPRGRHQGIIRSAVHGLAGGIGLVSESIATHKQDKTREENQDGPPNGVKENEKMDDDITEEQWELDETQVEILTTGQEPTDQAARDEDFVNNFLHKHSELPSEHDARLELPVILAQRRPKDRTRGFIRGYAPSLEDFGIDQKTWLEFLDIFEKSTKASPLLKIINFANIASFFVPIGASVAISASVGVAIKLARNTQNMQRTNKFLDEMNKGFFTPRGLYCLIITWRPDLDKDHDTLDLTSTIASTMDSYDSGIKGKFKSSSGKSYGDFSIPESAPLVFPILDMLDAADGQEAKGLKQSLAHKKKFLDEYYDKRARAEFEANNASNPLNQQEKPHFLARYADPNHASNDGSILSLITGGHVSTSVLHRASGNMFFGARGRANMWGNRKPLFPHRPSDVARNALFKKDVLYLMVVNMPTDEELASAQAFLDA